jgi:hypothetical protein
MVMAGVAGANAILARGAGVHAGSGDTTRRLMAGLHIAITMTCNRSFVARLYSSTHNDDR